MKARRLGPLAGAASLVLLAGGGTAAADPPTKPNVNQPAFNGVIVNPADVHMEATGFTDGDGDSHACSDWKIRTRSGAVAWEAPCAAGLERVHIHLGDGAFVNSHAGRTTLGFERTYVVVVRFRDSAGELSPPARRRVRTSRPGPPGVPSDVPWRTEQDAYEVETVAGGLQLPTGIAFVPGAGTHPDDPFLYVTELYGTIKVVTRDGSVRDYQTGLLNFDPTGLFPGSGEQGLTGIAVDPVSGDVFASMLYEDTSSAEEPRPHYAKVLRLHSLDGGLTAATQTTVLDISDEPQGASHQISNLTITPDRLLLVHNGDGFDPATALDLDSMRGKVLRTDLHGDPVPANPYYDASNGISARDHVFAYGFRNPFGGAWRSSNAHQYTVENGPSVDRLAKVVRGRGYSWDGSDESMRRHALYNWDPAHAPVGIAFVEPETFSGSGFPARKMDHAFVTESGPTYAEGPQQLGKRIVEFRPRTGDELGGPPKPFLEYTGVGHATAAGLAAGPDGLYFVDLYKDVDASTPIDPGARLLRVRYVGD